MTITEIALQTKRFRTQFPSQPKAFVIDFNEIRDLVHDNPNAKGLRGYLALDENGTLKMYDFPVDANGNDILPVENEPSIVSFIDNRPCPTLCGTTNVLNS